MPSDTGSVRICKIDSSHISEVISLGEEAKLSPWSAQNYIDELRSPDSIMLRAVSADNEGVGFIVGRIVPGAATGELDAEIYNIAVVTGHQFRGNGALLLKNFIARAAEKSVRNIWLEVRESNKTAISFYIRHGFEHVQTRPNFYDEPREAALLMRLRLADKSS